MQGRFQLNRNGVLQYRHKDRVAIAVPTSLIAIAVPNSLIASVRHWGHTQVHNGKGRMASIICARYWWFRLRDDVSAFCKTCNACQKVKGGGVLHKNYTLKQFSASAPFELLSIDIVGPLPQTSAGNRYFVSMIDKFSRFAMLVPVPDQDRDGNPRVRGVAVLVRTAEGVAVRQRLAVHLGDVR